MRRRKFQERRKQMASITRFEPFNELVDDLFKGFLVRPLALEGRAELPRMKVDVAEKNGAYVVAAEIPGVKKEDIQVSIDGAEVTLSADVRREKEISQDERVLHTERVFGKVTRSFTLPQEVDEAKAEAKYHDGVLALTLPKKRAAARKQISIQEVFPAAKSRRAGPPPALLFCRIPRDERPFQPQPAGRGEGAHPGRGAALHPALPRQDHRGEVRRQRHERRGAEGWLRTRRSAAQARRHEPGSGARRRAPDRAAARAPGQEGRIRAGHARHRQRDHGRGRDGARRPGQQGSGG